MYQLTIYQCSLTVKAQQGHLMNDEQVAAFLAGNRFNSLTAAIAIAVNNFNRASDGAVEIVAEVSE